MKTKHFYLKALCPAAISWLLACAFALPDLASAQSATGSQTTTTARTAKLELLEKARIIRLQNSSRIFEIQKRKKEIVEQSAAANLESDMIAIKSTLREHLERQEFWDRLIFEIDSHFAGGDIREFLRHRLVEMAKVEANSPDSTNLMKLFRYTSDIIKGLPERKNDILAVIEGYVRSNNPANPIEPDKFLARQDYSNGTKSEAAKTVSKETIGDIVEERLQRLNGQEKVQTE